MGDIMNVFGMLGGLRSDDVDGADDSRGHRGDREQDGDED